MDDRYEYKTYNTARFHIPEGTYSIEEVEEILATMKEMKRQHDRMLREAVQPVDKRGFNDGRKQWVGLTAKDLAEIPPSAYEGAIWADAKLREKNT